MTLIDPSQADSLPTAPLLQFTLSEQRFAVPIAIVQEVQRPVSIQPLIGLPPELPGVIDWHGQPLAVLDLRRRLKLSGQLGADSSDAALLLIFSKGHLLALPVDKVIGVARATGNAAFERGSGWDCIAGLIRISGQLITLLDADQLPFAALEALWSGLNTSSP